MKSLMALNSRRLHDISPMALWGTIRVRHPIELVRRMRRVVPPTVSNRPFDIVVNEPRTRT
jgi:hypothetical protein